MKTERTSLLMITVIFFLISSCSSTMVEKKGGLLWKISGNGLEQSSYLFGTAHGGPFFAANLVFGSIPNFEMAFSSIKQFIGENKDIQYFQEIFMDSTYQELLDKEDKAVLDSVLLKYLNKTSDSLKIRPSLLMLLIREKIRYHLWTEKIVIKMKNKKDLTFYELDEMLLSSEELMDMYLQRRAIKMGYPTVGLDDKINFQFDATDDSLSLKQQAVNMIHYFKNNLTNEVAASLELPLIDSLKFAYYEQDLDQIEKISVELYSDSTYLGEIQRKLIFERNFRWMEHIPTLIREKPSFIAVGVRHLPGENGLIDLLRKEGFTVEPL